MFTLNIFTVSLKNKNIIFKIRRSKVTDYAALKCMRIYPVRNSSILVFFADLSQKKSSILVFFADLSQRRLLFFLK